LKTVEVLFDLNYSLKEFKKYYNYRRRHEFKKFPSLLILGVSLLFIILGLALKSYFFIQLGIIILLLISVFLLYYIIRFQIAFNKFCKKLIIKAKELNLDCKFSFDSDEIIYEYKDWSTKIKWTLIKSYQENQNDLYLFYSHHQFCNIISESKLGKENYQEFKTILLNKINNN
jgi:hypothetical protein